MKLCVVGSGYVGLVTAACLAEVGQHVTGIDVDAAKVELLNGGGIPIFGSGPGRDCGAQPRPRAAGLRKSSIDCRCRRWYRSKQGRPCDC